MVGDILNDAVNVRGLQALVDPRAIAVIGASADAARIGGRTIYFLQRHGYAGRIYPVSHRGGAVQGQSLRRVPRRFALLSHIG